MKLNRLLAIVLLLLNRDRVTASDLARRFGVSVRTIYRDLESIDAAGIPIVPFQGHGGGYGIIRNYRLDRQVLTPDEMLSILSALRGMDRALDDQTMALTSEKIQSLVPRGRLERAEEELAIDMIPWGYGSNQRENLRTLHSSIVQRRLLSFVYFNNRAERSQRTVEPMTLIYKGAGWYLFAFCRMRQDYRVFRLSRMRDLEVAGKRFQRRQADYRDYVAGPDASPPSVDLVLKFAPRARGRVEDYFDPEGTEVCRDGSLLVRVSIPEDEWLYAILLSYTGDMEVISPPHVRKLIAGRIAEGQTVYRDTVGAGGR